MRLLACVVGLGKGLRDHQHGQVNTVAEQVRHDALHVIHGGVLILLDQKAVKALVNHRTHKLAVVAADGLDTLAVHLVPFHRVCPIQPSVPLLVHQKVRVVHLLEFQSNRRSEVLCDLSGSLLAKLHRLGHGVNPEFDHDRVGVPIHNLCVVFVAVRHGILLFHKPFRLINHLPPVCGDSRRYLEAGKLANLRSGETVHRVCADLQGELPAIEDGLLERVGFLLHCLFS
mmetsp:Transcript_34309/g.55686  ORF Transcript_34309/g.55686 Transcript_34309/m.55686 type:complete len:229 (-) Transcript_34309:1389-2075(-)